MSASRPRTKKQEQLRAMIENPRRRRFWAARSRRRQAVVALAAATLAGAAAFTASIMVEPPTSQVLLGVFVLMMAGVVVLATQVNIAARWVAGYQGVDELQRAEMDHASRLGYNLTAVLLTVLVAVTAGLGGALTGVDMDATVPMLVLVPMVLVVTLCHAAFPACYLAWTRPDEALDDEEEGAEDS